MSIEPVFNNERVTKTNYKPSYQRNYVSDDEKATYFIDVFLPASKSPLYIFEIPIK